MGGCCTYCSRSRHCCPRNPRPHYTAALKVCIRQPGTGTLQSCTSLKDIVENSFMHMAFLRWSNKDLELTPDNIGFCQHCSKKWPGARLATCHFLNQCWLIMDKSIMNKFPSNILRDSHIFHDKNATLFDIFFGMANFCRCLRVNEILVMLALYYTSVVNTCLTWLPTWVGHRY